MEITTTFSTSPTTNKNAMATTIALSITDIFAVKENGAQASYDILFSDAKRFIKHAAFLSKYAIIIIQISRRVNSFFGKKHVFSQTNA